MKTETIDGIKVVTVYAYKATDDAPPDVVDSIAALRARILQDVPDASPELVDRFLRETEESLRRGLAHSLANHPLQPGDEGYRGALVVSRRAVRLQCCRYDSGNIDLSPDGCAKAVNGWGRK